MDFLNWRIPVFFVIVLWLAAVIGMRFAWKKKAARQKATHGEFYPVPDDKGTILIDAIPGIYAGSVIPDRSAERFVPDGSGFRSSAELIGYSQGILCQRPGSKSLWIPCSAIVDMRIGKFFAGKVPPGGVLIITHRLHASNQRAVIETGFRVNPQIEFAGYTQWIEIYYPETSAEIPEKK